MTNSDKPGAMPDMNATDNPAPREDEVLGVLTGQVPVSGPMGKGGGSFTDRLREQVRNNAEEQEALDRYAEAVEDNERISGVTFEDEPGSE